ADAHGSAPLRRMAEGLHLDGSPRTLELTVLPVRWKAELALQVTLLDRTEELALREMSMQRDSELQDLIDGSLQ
ncbi:MAG: hypothetical protein GWO39_01850, partial [Gammaproteobacteria bacterium]|nr:hypothetical protein [Gammaproteobacteria bacterium]NIR96866.1 hypothetical protein [Gammaproteobacteria bacterium]NIT62573.1 hypothetical protein [Gammaproteobacteria bacterium]NIV19517.1 hypothetical protein [Gammaproteobacteria bacterium]NIY31153.1 hypothetical protein [Gammaproteobacteria bacterium]